MGVRECSRPRALLPVGKQRVAEPAEILAGGNQAALLLTDGALVQPLVRRRPRVRRRIVIATVGAVRNGLAEFDNGGAPNCVVQARGR